MHSPGGISHEKSCRLSDAKLEATGKYEIESLCLMDEPLVYLSGDFFKQRERLLAEGKRNHRRFDYAHQFAQADVIVVAAPSGIWASCSAKDLY